MTGLHESTLALSVYNVIARLGTMTAAQLQTLLANNWDERVTTDEVRAGIVFLEQRGMVTIADDVVAPAKLHDGAARTVVRNPYQLTELVWGNGAQKARGGEGMGVLG